MQSPSRNSRTRTLSLNINVNVTSNNSSSSSNAALSSSLWLSFSASNNDNPSNATNQAQSGIPAPTRTTGIVTEIVPQNLNSNVPVNLTPLFVTPVQPMAAVNLTLKSRFENTSNSKNSCFDFSESPTSLIAVVDEVQTQYRRQILKTSPSSPNVNSNTSINSSSFPNRNAINGLSGHETISPSMRCISGNTLVQLPREVLGRIFLQLESPAPARFLGVCRTINAALGGDAHLLATWLVVHTPGTVANNSCNSNSNYNCNYYHNYSLRPVAPVHPLLATMKHSARCKLLDRNPRIIELLLALVPRIPRYELQRIYRRAVTYECIGYSGLRKCADIVANWSIQFFGEPVSTTVPFHKPPSLPNVALVNAFTNAETITEIAPAAEGPAGIQHAQQGQYPVDDRRLLLNATESGNRNVIVDVLTRAALILDARVLADAFIRAWDNADPHLLCLPRIGILWPRCSASRWFILEKLVQEEDEVVRVFSLQLPPNNGAGVLPIPPPGDVGIDLADEIVDTVMHSMRVCFALIEDEVKSTLARRRSSTKQSFAMKEKQEKFGGFKGLTVSRNCDTLLAAGVLHEVVGIARLDDEEHRNDDQGWEEQEKDKDYDIANINQRRISHILSVELISQKVFKRRKCIYTDIWEPSIPFVQRAFDAFVAFGSVRMVALMLYSHGQQIRVKPYHLTAALDRFSLPLVYFLIQYAGANPTWPEDVSLFGYIRRPTDPSLFGGPVPSIASLDASGRACWVWALRQGVNITERQWIAIVKLGPATVSAVVEHYGAAVFDPCRDDMAGFKHGSANVVRILSHVIDGRYSGSSKCVLWEAAYGDGVALTYLIRLGEILAHDLKRGDRERVMELLDAGAIILDQVLLVAAGISDRAPGEWDEWPLAARCYRRVLVQRRMGLPIPSMDTLQRLPETVVTTTFLAALFSTRPIYCNPLAANIYSLYQRRRHPNAAGVRINLVPVLEREVAVRVVETAMDNLRELLKMCDDPAYPGEAYCFIKGMLQFGLRDKNLLRDEDEFFLPDDEWEEVASALLGHK